MTRERKTRQSRAPVRVGQRKLAPSGRERGGVTGPAVLQRRLGNRGTQAWMNVQTKLTLGQPGDRYEREADAVAEQVVGGRLAPRISRLDTSRGARSASVYQPAGEASTVSPSLEAAIQRVKGGGQALASQVRTPMEQAFESDFSRTRVHTDVESDRLNRSLHARAFTAGQDVFFQQGAYNPSSREGQTLIAHELAHVVQQKETHLSLSNGFEAGRSLAGSVPRKTARTLMGCQQSILIKQNISTGTIARDWSPGRRQPGELAGVPGGLYGYIRRVRGLLNRGARTPLSMTALEEMLNPLRQRTRLNAPSQPNAEDAQDLQEFFSNYEGGVSAFVEQLSVCLERMARVSGQRSRRFPGETREDRNRGARAWLIDFSNAIGRTYSPITVAVQDPARRLFDIDAAETAIRHEEVEQGRAELEAVDQLIAEQSAKNLWIANWRTEFTRRTDNIQRLGAWLIDRWDHSEINDKLEIARWRPGRNPGQTGYDDYRTSYAVSSRIVRDRLGVTAEEGRIAGNNYFRDVYENYLRELRQLGCDLTNYLLPRHSSHMPSSGTFDRAAFSTRADAWGRLSTVTTPTRLPHHDQIRGIFVHFNNYRGREIPAAEFATDMAAGTCRYSSGIWCSTNGCIFPNRAVRQ